MKSSFRLLALASWCWLLAGTLAWPYDVRRPTGQITDPPSCGQWARAEQRSDRGGGQSRPPTKWWQSDRFKQGLNLTAEQSAKLEEIFQASLPKLKEYKDTLDRMEAALSKLMADNKVDEAQIVQEINRVEAARSELSKVRTLMLFHMHRVLSPEQRVKLNAIHEQERDRRKPPGS